MTTGTGFSGASTSCFNSQNSYGPFCKDYRVSFCCGGKFIANLSLCKFGKMLSFLYSNFSNWTSTQMYVDKMAKARCPERPLPLRDRTESSDGSIHRPSPRQVLRSTQLHRLDDGGSIIRGTRTLRNARHSQYAWTSAERGFDLLE